MATRRDRPWIFRRQQRQRAARLHLDVANRDVRTEGMSYGMMIAVQLDKKAEFDALWNWAKTFMYHAATNHPASGYFSWSMQTNGTPNDEMPAPDGEEYFATALVFRFRPVGRRQRHL